MYLSTVGAIGGFVAYTYALRHLPVSFVSLYAYINPVIAVALGVLVLHEPFTSRMAVAAALVFAGVAVVRWEQRPGSSPRSLRRRQLQAGSRSEAVALIPTRRQTRRPLTNRTRNSTIAMTSRT